MNPITIISIVGYGLLFTLAICMAENLNQEREAIIAAYKHKP